MKNYFKPEDFSSIMSNEGLACAANTKLQELIESWPVVYGIVEGLPSDIWGPENTLGFSSHKARLAFIEEIKKEPCKHEPKRNFQNGVEMLPEPKCYHCGVELQAEWREVK